MDGDTLGNRIRARRENLGITQAKLASLVGLTTRAINQMEVGILTRSFMADHLPLIAIELETTTEVLLQGESQSERATSKELERMRKEGIFQSAEELEGLRELSTESIRKRSNANIPLSREELLILLEVMRGADGY